MNGSGAPNGTPWYARLGASVLTTQGLATLLTLILVGFLLWSGYRLVTDMRDVARTQVLQQERIIAEIGEANAQLRAIRLLLETGGGSP